MKTLLYICVAIFMLFIVSQIQFFKPKKTETYPQFTQKAHLNIPTNNTNTYQKPIEVTVGAENIPEYLPILQNKKIALVVNHTALVQNTHLVDTIIAYKNTHNIEILRIFAPEHGFRGDADAGETIANTTDKKTRIPLISLYGKQKKPTKEHLKDIDLVIFDMQDVGVRFYTYISTLHYVMEACAEHQKTLLILDRPNPRGEEIEGNIRRKTSFVAMHPIPVVHGLTIAELAQMINGEKWLKNKAICDIKIIKNKNYTHKTPYILPVRPSPNLPNALAVALYPSLCLFEGTPISVGRGTDFPFEVAGVPFAWGKGFMPTFTFAPVSKFGAKNPLYKGKVCYGINIGKLFLTKKNTQKTDFFQIPFTLQYVIDFYKKCPQTDRKKFFAPFFDTLVGDTLLRTQIIQGLSEKQIRKSWQKDIENYKKMRKKYLLYD